MVLLAAVAGTLGVLMVTTALGVVAAPPSVRLLAVAALVLGAFALAGLGRTVRQMASPFADLVEAASRVEEGDYTARVRVRGPREARALARAFNAMSARLETTDTQRRTFLADVAHELRTPLSVIRGQLEAVLDGVYPPDSEHLQPILDQTETLEHLVEDLRTLALTETGSLTLVREPVDLAELVDEVVASFRTNASAAGVALSNTVGSELPSVHVDPARTRSVLANLLANAIRHTPSEGSVEVSAETDGDDRIAVSVRDTGAGISPEILPRVFDRFVKEPGSPGSGLGLAIARDLVVAQGGTITAASEVGAGTTIRFTLPRSA